MTMPQLTVLTLEEGGLHFPSVQVFVCVTAPTSVFIQASISAYLRLPFENLVMQKQVNGLDFPARLTRVEQKASQAACSIKLTMQGKAAVAASGGHVITRQSNRLRGAGSLLSDGPNLGRLSHGIDPFSESRRLERLRFTHQGNSPHQMIAWKRNEPKAVR